VPVGFKWFVDGLVSGALRLRRRGERGRLLPAQGRLVWTTDKDGIILDLLAAEITAKTGKDPGLHYRALERARRPLYERMDAPANREQKAKLGQALAGEGQAPRRWPASPSWPSSRTRRATARRSAGSRWSPRTAGSRRGPPAPRTSTRSTPIVRESLRGGDAPEPGWLEAGIGLFGKPGRLVRMVQARGLDPSRVVLVADETRDFEAAGSAGIGFVGVAWGYATPEVLHAAGAKEVMATVDRLRSRLLGEPEVPGGHDLPGDEVRS
jgi:hypothetical protein